MVQALKLRIQHFPKDAIEAWIGLGKVYDQEPSVQDQNAALSAFREAVNITPIKLRDMTMNKIPPAYRDQISVGQP
ncbi:MAG: hypothetical protein IT506_08990 [Aquabacterium sp.]|nr:hypothetical protein [Aquabacterium sp.]